MRTINIYSFNELDEQAKIKAVESALNNDLISYNWNSENIKTLNNFANVFNLSIRNYNLDDCMNSFIAYRLNLDDDIKNLKGLRLHKYIINNYFNDLFVNKYYSVKEKIAYKKIYHPRIKGKILSNGKNLNSYYSGINFDSSCVLTGFYVDDEILKPIYEFLKHPTDKSFKCLIDDCINSFIEAVESDTKATFETDNIIEFLQANDYEFNINGSIYND